MNRELKFRAFYQKKLYMQEYCGGFSYFIHNDSDALTLEDIFVAAERQKCIIQQYTGLKDSEGVEIYEGDILMPDTIDGIWPEQRNGVLVKDIRQPFANAHLFKIVGNIFENPELLNQ